MCVCVARTSGMSAPSPPHAPISLGDGARCGPQYSYLRCSCAGPNNFCDDFTGFCGGSAAFRDAQPTDAFDCLASPPSAPAPPFLPPPRPPLVPPSPSPPRSPPRTALGSFGDLGKAQGGSVAARHQPKREKFGGLTMGGSIGLVFAVFIPALILAIYLSRRCGYKPEEAHARRQRADTGRKHAREEAFSFFGMLSALGGCVAHVFVGTGLLLRTLICSRHWCPTACYSPMFAEAEVERKKPPEALPPTPNQQTEPASAAAAV